MAEFAGMTNHSQFITISNSNARTPCNPAMQVMRQNKLGRMCLHFAAENGSVDIIQALLQDPRMVDPDAPNHMGKTALMCACEMGHADAARVLASRAGVNVNRQEIGSKVRDQPGFRNINPLTPLLYACLGREGSVTGNRQRGTGARHDDVVAALTAMPGLDVNSRSPLLLCCSLGRVHSARHLLRAGALVNLCNTHSDGREAPLHVACMLGQLDVVTLLLDTLLCPDRASLNPYPDRANPNPYPDRAVDRAMHPPPANEPPGGTAPLPPLPRSPSAMKKITDIPIYREIRQGVDGEEPPSVLPSSACGRRPPSASIAPPSASIALRLDVNLADAWGYTPLLHACRAGQQDCIRLLLTHPGCGDLDVNASTADGDSPLGMVLRWEAGGWAQGGGGGSADGRVMVSRMLRERGAE